MPESPTSPAEQLFPPRFWWLKRIAVAMVLFGCVLVGLRYTSLAVARRRLEAEISAIKARGEPLTPEDFLDRPASAEDDAGPDLLAALKLFAIPRQHLNAWYQISHFKFSPQDAPTIEAVLAANQPALAKVRAARGKRVVNWGLPELSPTVVAKLSMLHDMRELNHALASAALKALAEGKHDQAVEYLRDWLMLGRAMESQPLLLSSVVASSMQSLAARTSRNAAFDLHIGRGVGDASEAQVRALMQELLDERKKERSGWVWAWQGERATNMQFIEALASDDGRSGSIAVPIYAPIVRWWMRPALVANADDLLSRTDAFVKAAGAPDDAGAREILRESEARSRRNQYSAVLDSSGYSNLNTQFMDLYFRRQAVVALASRMFQLKYGREAKSVDELIPEFLKQIPRDPLMGSSMKLVAHPSIP